MSTDPFVASVNEAPTSLQKGRPPAYTGGGVAGLFPLRLRVLSLEREGWATLGQHIALHQPLLIDDLAADWPALQKWTRDHLRERYGHKPVRVYDASFAAPGEHYMGNVDVMQFSDFLRETLGEGRDLRMFLYNIARQIPELLDDVVFPDLGLRFSRRFVFAFFGCRGATTPLHFDIDMGHVFYTAVQGRRRVRLFAPDQSPALHRHPFTVRSYANLDELHAGEMRGLAHAQGYEVVVEPGQTLFMPSGYWHEYHYLDAGFGISLRAPSPRLQDRARGLANLLALSPIDRLGNKLAAGRWFEWKRRRAESRANAFLTRDGTH